MQWEKLIHSNPVFHISSLGSCTFTIPKCKLYSCTMFFPIYSLNEILLPSFVLLYYEMPTINALCSFVRKISMFTRRKIVNSLATIFHIENGIFLQFLCCLQAFRKSHYTLNYNCFSYFINAIQIYIDCTLFFLSQSLQTENSFHFEFKYGFNAFPIFIPYFLLFATLYPRSISTKAGILLYFLCAVLCYAATWRATSAWFVSWGRQVKRPVCHEEAFSAQLYNQTLLWCQSHINNG